MVKVGRQKLGIRSTDRYSGSDLELAILKVNSGEMTLNSAAKVFRIPSSILKDKISGKRGIRSGARGCAIPLPLEKELASILKTMDIWGFHLSRSEIFCVAQTFVKENGLKTPFKNGMPGEDWFRGFKKRHDLSLRRPDRPKNDYYHQTKMDPFIVYKFFDLLKSFIITLGINKKPHLIWALRETSFTHECLESSSGEDSTGLSIQLSGIYHDCNTVLACGSASGKKVPPLIVFKGKDITSSWLPPPSSYFGTVYESSESGWITSDMFEKWFTEAFIPSLGQERPVIIIYDGFSTYVSPKLIRKARREKIVILKLPFHKAYSLHPIDSAVFSELKSSWKEEVNKKYCTNLGELSMKYGFAELFGILWTNLSESSLQKSFKSTGIYDPQCEDSCVNQNIIPETAFVADALNSYKNTLKKSSPVFSFDPREILDSISDSDSREYEKEEVSMLNVCSPSVSGCYSQSYQSESVEVMTE